MSSPALPQVPGPKLTPFTPDATVHEIEFLEELGGPEEAADSHVWKVRINGMQPCYALKMFRFKTGDILKEISYLRHPLASDQLYIDYFDPFNSECRAYGRLKEEKREDLALRAHGYLFLTPQQEAKITDRLGGIRDSPIDVTDSAAELDGYNVWGRYEEHRHLPIRAIVKDLATDRTPFTPAHVTQLWRDLEDLHKLGILVRDIGLGNYMGGKLIDFSRSWAMPHPSLEDLVESQRRSDPSRLHNAIIDWGIEDRWTQDELVIPEELVACVVGKGQNGRFGTDPSKYGGWKLEGESCRDG